MEKTREEIMLVFSTISMVSIRLREVIPLPENKDERLCFVLRFINEAVDKELAYLSQEGE